MAILYVETNLLVAIATGRDDRALPLIQSPPPRFRIAIPGICFLEALDWMEDEVKRHNVFINDINRNLSELRRDLTSTHADRLFAHLTAAKIEKDAILRDIDDRLSGAEVELSLRGEILNLTGGTVVASRQTVLIRQLTDNLILHTILDHARADHEPIKAFLTENHRDFGATEAQAALKSAGIALFSTSEQFLEWASSSDDD